MAKSLVLQLQAKPGKFDTTEKSQCSIAAFGRVCPYGATGPTDHSTHVVQRLQPVAQSTSLCDGVWGVLCGLWQCSAARSGQEPEGVANQPDCRRIHLEALNALSFRQKNVLGFRHLPRALSHHVYQREWLTSSFFTWSSNCSVPRLSCQARWPYLQKGS
jgi:hypothetical protein